VTIAQISAASFSTIDSSDVDTVARGEINDSFSPGNDYVSPTTSITGSILQARYSLHNEM